MQRAPAVILVVEDDPTTRDLVRELLELEGYTVESTADGAAGQARLAAGGVDLVLLDLMLPELDGLELCRRVRAAEDGAYLPILMLTALTATEQRHAGFVAGADDYVTKPFDTEELLDRVRVWLRTRQRLKDAHERRKQQEVERTREAALEGVLWAAQAMHRTLSRKLAVVAGFAEVLTVDPLLPPHLYHAATEALTGAKEGEALLSQLQQVTSSQLAEVWDPLGEPTIEDLLRGVR